MKPTLEKILMAHVKISERGCWEWQRSRDADGYGVLKGGGEQRAHRQAYRIFKGPIPDGKCVLHTCDNPPCANPNHLFTGTRKDNAVDCKSKGRNNPRRGENHPKVTITVLDVIKIKLIYAAGGWSHRTLAIHMGIKLHTVTNVLLHNSWKSVEIISENNFEPSSDDTTKPVSAVIN